MKTNYCVYKTKVGNICIEYTDTAVVSVSKIQEEEKNKGCSSVLSDLAFNQLKEYFDGKRKVFDFPYELHGTEFQKKVWKALCDIPYGETCSYKDIAIAVGNSKASRAVGMANNKNPIFIIVPCHRVIGANGKLVGYGGGLGMKTTLLELEKKYKSKSGE